MNLYLESSLANHRHGRFFISQLDAKPADELPSRGLLLMHGKFFQGLDTSKQETWWQWASKPGCGLLLLPPYNAGAVFERLDWQLVIREDMASSNDGIIPNTVCAEVTLNLTGSDGEFDRSLGHQWTDYSVNTRYIKQHQGCGVFAATCLPLWSISLLDYAQDTLDWLDALLGLAGKASEDVAEAIQMPEVQLKPTDYTLMVCMQAWGVHTAEAISSALTRGSMSLISIPEVEVVEGISRLRLLGLIDDAGMTSVGLNILNESPYGRYVEHLKEEAPL